jgi:hypothetical protein
MGSTCTYIYANHKTPLKAILFYASFIVFFVLRLYIMVILVSIISAKYEPELTLGHIRSSAEATISMKVIHGSWPDGCRGAFAAKTASIDGVEFALLLTGDDDELPVADDGTIELQRKVVCAEVEKEEEHLEVCVEAKSISSR